MNTWASLEEGVGSQDQESAAEQNHKRSLSAQIHSLFEHLSSEPPQNLQEQKGLPWPSSSPALKHVCKHRTSCLVSNTEVLSVWKINLATPYQKLILFWTPSKTATVTRDIFSLCPFQKKSSAEIKGKCMLSHISLVLVLWLFGVCISGFIVADPWFIIVIDPWFFS